MLYASTNDLTVVAVVVVTVEVLIDVLRMLVEIAGLSSWWAKYWSLWMLRSVL